MCRNFKHTNPVRDSSRRLCCRVFSRRKDKSPDDPQGNSSRKKPKLPLSPVVTSDFALVRFISHPQQKYNEAFLSEWVLHISNWLKQNKTIYFFVHCPQEERSPDTAFYLQSLLQQQGVNLPIISQQPTASTPIQLNLF